MKELKSLISGTGWYIETNLCNQSSKITLDHYLEWKFCYPYMKPSTQYDAIKNDLIKEGKLGPDFVPDNLLSLVNKNS